MQGLCYVYLASKIELMKYLLPILLLFNLAAYAADGDSITAYVKSSTVKRNQPFEAGVKYSGSHKYSVKLNEAEGVTVFSGPNTSSQIQIMNGVTTSSGSFYYMVKTEHAGKLSLQFEVSEYGQLIGMYTVGVEVLQAEWTKADEQAQAEEKTSTNPFDDDFFKDFQQPTHAPIQKQTKYLNKKDMAKLVSFEPRFNTYDVAVGDEITIRYIVRFNKVSEQYNNIAQMYLAKLPSAKHVYVQMAGTDEMSSGSRKEDEQAQQIAITAVCQKPGKFSLSPLVIKYNGKRYKAARVTLNTIYKGKGIEI